MAKEKTLEDLFHDTLKDIYYAERKILKALPKMKRAAQSDQLKAAFEKHHQETEGQIERLQQVFELMGKRAQGKTCDAVEGIISEGEEIMDEFKGTAALDAGLAARAVADLMPLLASGCRISVLTVQDEKPLPGKDIAESLSSSGVQRDFVAEPHHVALAGRTVAEALQEAAVGAGADLLAMGGFGHSRVRDFVLGGATKGIFADLRLPVLLSH